MTPAERAQSALAEIRARHWTAESVLDVVEHHVAVAVRRERQRCARLVRLERLRTEYAAMRQEATR